MGHYSEAYEYDEKKLRARKNKEDAIKIIKIKELIKSKGIEGVILQLYNKELHL